jgi:hypothetical protein
MSDQPSSHLTPEEVATVSQLLGRLEPGFLPLPIFLAVARLVTTVTLEFVAIRQREGKVEVFMTKRPDDDAHWPGLWHFTGSVVRSTDVTEGLGADYSPVFQRIIKDEFAGRAKLIGEPTYVTTNFWTGARGVEYTPVFFVEADSSDLSEENDRQDGGRFFAIDEIPENTVSHHKVLLPLVVEAFLKSKQA